MIPITSIALQADKGWRFSWPDQGAAYYRVVLNGDQVAKVTATTYTWHGQGYASSPPPLEVTYEGRPALSESFAPYMVLQWYGEAQAAQYQVQQYDGVAWRPVGMLLESGQWLYTFRTPLLTDETVYDFRVVAVNQAGDVSAPKAWERLMVCPPAPPAVSVSYAPTTITVATP